MIDAHPIQGFIGRESALREISGLVQDVGRRYLVSVHGQGGVGKTYLLRKLFQDYAGHGQFRCFGIVDFSQSKTRTVRWLMSFIVGQTPVSFGRYHEVWRALEQAGQTPTAGARSQDDLEEAFLDDFARLERRVRCIFLFDTLELIQDTLLFDLVLKMAGRSTNSVFILAGRRNEELEPRLIKNLGVDSVLPVTLTGFTEEDTIAYIQQNLEGVTLTEDEQRALYLLSEEGIPIKLALALDWLSRGLMMKTLVSHSFEALRQYHDQEPAKFAQITAAFEKELVTQIGQLGTDVDRAIYIMAHVHKRFNRELLQLLVPQADTDALLVKVCSLPFVKPIEEDYFVLHDEIQRMILQHIWEWSDPRREQRREISKKVLAYYDRKLASLYDRHRTDGEVTRIEEWEYRIYEIERLHYLLDIDLVAGYQHFVGLFEELEDRRDIELAALALDVLVKDRPLPTRLRNFVSVYYRGWVLVRRQYLEQACDVIEQGLPQLTAPPATEDLLLEQQSFLEQEVEQRLGEVYTLLGYCHRLLGDWATAIEHYEAGRELNEKLIASMQEAKTSDASLIRRSISRLAETLNDIANLQRMQGELTIARRYCKTSLLIREKLGERRVMGHCCYVMAMIMWESGATSEAMNYLQQARSHYQATNAEQEGAWVDHYEGYVMFRTGNIEAAKRLLTSALDVVSENPSFRDEHAEVLLFWSRIHRQEDTAESRAQAMKDALSALEIAQQVGNDYRLAECYLTLCLTLYAMPEAERNASREYARFDEFFQKGLKLAQTRKYRRLETVFAELEADLAFARKDHVLAFEKYVLACQRGVQFKPPVFERMLSNLSRRLDQLLGEDTEQVLGICDRIEKQWRAAGLDTRYPQLIGEIEYVRDIAQHMSQRQALEYTVREAIQDGAWEKALEVCEALDQLPIHDHPDRATVLQHRAEVYHGENSYSWARLLCERAIRVRAADHTDAKALGDCYLLLSRIYWKLGNTAESAAYLDSAKKQYQQVDSKVGLGLVELDRAYIHFRTHQYDQTNRGLVEAQTIFKATDEPVYLASTLNVMSRLARIDPRRATDREIAYAEAQRRAEEGLRVLGDLDWFVSAELHLSLCILHYVWGKLLLQLHRADEAAQHFEHSLRHNRRGSEKTAQVESPVLHSVYSGMRANLFLLAGEKEKATESFFEELVYATQTKHIRLIGALDLLENWLASEPRSGTEQYGNWLIAAWRKEGLSERFPDVETAIQWLVAHRRYIPEGENERQ